MRTFVDGAGRQWHLRATLGRLMDLEAAQQISVLDARSLETWLAARVENSARLAYGLLDLPGGVEVSFTEFAAQIDDYAALAKAVSGALEDFFPKPPPIQAGTTEANAAPGPGATSTNSPPAPA